jgi:N-acetylmuramoyl-L-alanine amidase
VKRVNQVRTIRKLLSGAICLVAFLLLIAIPVESAGDSASIGVVYPTETAVIEAPASFIVGAIPPGHTLSCNGQKVRVNEFGYYAHVVALHHGPNRFTLSLDDGSVSRQVVVTREPALVHISEEQLAIGSIEPSQDLGVKYGDTINFAVRATPNSTVSVRIQNRLIELKNAVRKVPGKRSTLVTHGQGVANGRVYERLKDPASDLYNGFYRISPDDHWQAQPAIVTVTHNGKTTEKASAGRVWTVSQPSIAQTAAARTIVRLGPGLARTTPLDEGVRVEVDGWVGTQMRCQYTPQLHVWIDRQDLVFESGAPTEKRAESGVAPQAVVRTINIRANDYGQSIRIPLEQRLPYQAEQKLSPNSLTLRIFGVTSDTDWISPMPGNDSKNEGAQLPAEPIDHLDWKQPSDGQYEVTAHLQGARQWGYKIYYEGTTLCLDVKRAVKLAEGSKRLTGIKVCVDPGHGGSEMGSVGCSGVHESEINLAMAMRLKELLENEGATVIMTRTSDSQEQSLDERVRIATEAGVDFLISVHNNALPDGAEPWKDHGTTSFWYHPQSLQLARCLKDSVVHTLGWPDLGARYQNLALCRPTAMPAVLVEVGFMINPDEYAKLIDSSVQHKAAEGLLDGLLTYLRTSGD